MHCPKRETHGRPLQGTRSVRRDIQLLPHSIHSPGPSAVAARYRLTGGPKAVAQPTSPTASTRMVTFYHSEQYFMYCKALLLGDKVAAAKLLGNTSPADCKAIGRTVKGFQPGPWDRYKLVLMEEALWWKFGGGDLPRSAPERGQQERPLPTAPGDCADWRQVPRRGCGEGQDLGYWIWHEPASRRSRAILGPEFAGQGAHDGS